MTDDSLLSAWLLDREAVDLNALPALAQDGQLGPADLQLQPVASWGDSMTVQLSGSGTPPPPGALLYVGERGTFEVQRRGSGAWPRSTLAGLAVYAANGSDHERRVGSLASAERSRQTRGSHLRCAG